MYITTSKLSNSTPNLVCKVWNGTTCLQTYPLTSNQTYSFSFSTIVGGTALSLEYTSSTTDTYKVQDITIKNRPNYTATVLSAADYYAFGMQKPGRTFNSGSYRYAYNGMEVDPETKGNGNSYTTEFRQYDPRIGRWLSLDPLMAQFPWQSPYVAFDDNPVVFVDPLGLKSEGWGGNTNESGGITWTYSPEITKDNHEGYEFYLDEGLRKNFNTGDGYVGDVYLEFDGTKTKGAESKIKCKELGEVKVSPKQFAMRIIMVEHEHYINDQSFWQWLTGVDNWLKGNSTWTYGIEFKTKDGNWNGNTANPVKLKDADKVITLYWDDISELSEALGAIGKDSKVGNWLEQAENLVHEEQNKGKNWDETNNRNEKQAISIKTSKDIMVYVWKYTDSYHTSRGTMVEGPYENENELKEAYPNAVWNEKEGYWEAGAIPKR